MKMRSRFIRFFIISLIFYWLAYIGLIIAFRAFASKQIDIFDITFTTLITSIIVVGFISIGIFVTLKPKFNFLESSQIDQPSFSSTIFGYYDNVNIPYAQLKSKIEKNWIITHADNDQKILKFCSKINIYDWGYGGYLAYDNESRRVNCALFPFTRKNLKTKSIDKLNSILESSFQVQNKK